MMLSRTALFLLWVTVLTGFALQIGEEANANTPRGNENLPASERPLTGMTALAPGQAAQDVSQALAIADPVKRASRLASMLDGLAPEAVPEVVALIEPRLGDASWIDLGLLLQWWVIHEPLAAFAWVQENVPERAQALHGVLVASLAYRDFEAARELVESGPLSPHIASMRASLVRGGYDAGRPEVMDYLVGLGRGSHRQMQIFVLAKRISRREGPDAAMKWALGLSETHPRFKLQAFRRVGKALTAVDPAAARRWAAEQRFGDYGDGVLEMVSRNEAKRHDPLETLEWLGTLPDGPDLSGAGKEAFLVWVKKDKEAARSWLGAASPDESWLDGARVTHVAWVVSHEGPNAALEWIDRIHDEQMRAQAVQYLIGRWLRIDRAAAEAWVAEADLDEHQRGMLERAVAARRKAADR